MTPEERGRLVAVTVEEHIRQAVAEPQAGWNHMVNFLSNVAHGVYVMNGDADDAEPLLIPRETFISRPFGEWPGIVKKLREEDAKKKRARKPKKGSKGSKGGGSK